MANTINVKFTPLNKSGRHGFRAYNQQPINIRGLRELLLVEMKDIYWAEKVLTKALPIIIRHTATHELSEVLRSHLKLIKKNITMLETMFKSMDEEFATFKSSHIIEMIHEITYLLKESDSGKIRDLKIIGEKRKIELQKITTYGVLCYFARRLGEGHIVQQLEAIIKIEKAADLRYSEIAQFFINTAEASSSD